MPASEGVYVEKTNTLPDFTLVVFGASGDLTRRKLVPALHSLDCTHSLPENTCLLGVGRSQLSDEDFREQLHQGVQENGRLEPEMWGGFAKRLWYLSGEYDDPQTYQRIRQKLDEMESDDGMPPNHLFYLAVPPVVYPAIVENLGKCGLNRSRGWTRIIIEKPFGHDLESARRLNDQVHRYFDESQVYRIDHYLGKETVQNLLALRFANYLFNQVWDRENIEYIQISAAEDIAVGERGGYYDQAGVIRDMLQNHLLQLVALTAMEPPAEINAKTLRDEKVKVLRAVREINLEDGVWGQYEGYTEEKGVASGSKTPTYLALRLFINNWRWQGVPFYLRSGKSLKNKATEILLAFKQVPHLIFDEGCCPHSNRLAICIQPDEGLHLTFEIKMPGEGMKTSPVDMDFHYKEMFGEKSLPDAYERLLLDAVQGDASLFARSDEIERAWELVTPLLQEWESRQEPPIQMYQPGTWGPEAAQALLGDERAWELCCTHDD